MVRSLGSGGSHDTRATVSLFLNCTLVLVVGGEALSKWFK